ncbi:hypothetical protein DID88_010440 [Monilinia fructigena]|uniref:Uncharacterized protein n=1 Tax=Monilinia fructigena TaxID=38457 RepID=A0A395ILF0_9HELO|nr:hypothetical protein DID88_010440 [Monilinia fructigena]
MTATPLCPSMVNFSNTFLTTLNFAEGNYSVWKKPWNANAADIDQVRQLVKKDADNATLSFRAIDNQKLPTPYQTPGIWATKSTANPNSSDDDTDAQDLISFFSSTADELDATLKKYQSNFTEIEAHLRSLEQSTAQQTQALLLAAEVEELISRRIQSRS